MFKKDPLLKLDSSIHSPHQIIPSLIRKNNALVLDVGCNNGLIGKEIIRLKQAVVDGIDINAEALEEAKKCYRRIFQRDLSIADFKIDNEKYDYIIFSDILEHLPRPDLILRESKKFLKNDGKVIISLPNVARFEIRLELLFGNFGYKPGILSEDHLRFFTQKSATKMLEECGYEIEETIPTGMGHKLGIFLNLTAFQFIYVCKKYSPC
jgi:2-polyprenyl-3-methyl-5-hydroxy-6-metoxy-1,4-benzoquinol methylase